MEKSKHRSFLQGRGIPETTRIFGHDHPLKGEAGFVAPFLADAAPQTTGRAAPPCSTVYQEVGEPLLHRLVRRHHDRLRLTGINGLVPDDEAEFQSAITLARHEMVVACGGPRRPSCPAITGQEEFRSLSFLLDDHLRAVWLAELWLAMGDVRFPAKLRPAIWEWAETLVLSLLKQESAPMRYPYDQAGIALARHMHPLPAVFKAL